MTESKFLRINQLACQLSLGKSTIWAKVKTDPDFPKPIKISPRITVWRSADIEQWMEWMEKQCHKGEEK